MNRTTGFVITPILFLISLLFFQNCGPGFKVGGEQLDLSSSAGGGLATGLVQYTDFVTCRGSSTTSSALAACMNTAGKSTGYTSANIDTCQAAGATTDLALAVCLSKAGPVILNHRPPKQYDIDACASAVGITNAASCLNQKGILSGVTQVQISTCAGSAGLSGIEKCLRFNNAIPKKGTLLQSDINLCVSVTGSNAAVASCLLNSELVPQSLVQADIDACIAAVGIGGVARCLRNNYKVSKVLLQPHLAECASLVGTANIGACIENNGLNLSYTAAEMQTAVNTCLTANGGTVANMAKCLRAANAVPPQVTQAAINVCSGIVGPAAIYNCLSANFPTAQLPGALNQTAVDSCYNTTGVGLAGLKKCLTAARKIFSDMPVQADIYTCSLYAGTAPMATNALQVGIGACLDAQGLALGTLTQAQIDGCITAVGVNGVETCLYNRGHIGSYQRLLTGASPQNALARCVTCHGLTAGAGGMSIETHASVILRLTPGNPSGSFLYNRILRNVAGITPMPPDDSMALNTEEIERVRVWIAQGARNN